ncbi:MAG: hypothetical protein HY698_07870 [Deltaproteobacteria bacterium]|nr:hypothetical protein [Deltaproteobacteria bacterium]
MSNPIIDVQALGQSIWYDNLRRAMLTSGELRDMVEKDGLLGVTSNPSIFEKAIAGSTDYDESLKTLVGSGDAKAIYERLAIDDIRGVADVLRPVFEKTEGRDGYVSQLESRCPGHPEYGFTQGVETTTGPLGQGVATSVGMAIAERWLAGTFNRPARRGNEDLRGFGSVHAVAEEVWIFARAHHRGCQRAAQRSESTLTNGDKTCS